MTQDPRRRRSDDRLFDDGPVVAIRWRPDPQRSVESVSPNISRLGYTAEDLESGRVPYRAVVHPEDLVRVEAETARRLEEGCVRWEQDYRVVGADGAVHRVLDVTVAQRDGEGCLLRLVGYLLDRGAWESRHESELRNSQLLLALEGTGTGLWDLRLPGGEVFLDRESRELAGMGSGQDLTQIDQWLTLLHPEDRPRVEEALNAHLGGATPQLREELRLARPDGTWRWLLLTGRVMEREEDGRALRLLGAVHDIHGERQRAEETLRLREQTLRLQRMSSLEQVAGGVAHRFNNLLAAILGQVELLGLDPAAGPALRAGLAEIQSSAATAAELAQAMLAYTGNRILEARDLDPNAWLRDLHPRLEADVGGSVALAAEPDLPQARLDAAQVEAALLQVLRNAAEAGSPWPLEMRVARVESPEPARQPSAGVEPAAPGPFLHIQVRDLGPGMEAGHLERIFDPFFTTRFVGRGLGMATVRGVALAHRGGLLVHSRPGTGTQVDFYFPLDAGGTVPGDWQDLLSEQGVLLDEH